MSREIKFRVSNGQHTIGYETLVDGQWFASDQGIDWSNGTYTGEKLRRWQYTGCKDKNGVEIYMGDIVICDRHRCSVVWQQSDCSFRYKPEFEDSHFYVMPYNNDEEVIGNIYETPELLPTAPKQTKEEG